MAKDAEEGMLQVNEGRVVLCLRNVEIGELSGYCTLEALPTLSRYYHSTPSSS
jgi:hypothetical protein